MTHLLAVDVLHMLKKFAPEADVLRRLDTKIRFVMDMITDANIFIG